jgi:ATP-dependent exoDNAse (exonuclease V) alpha subunit
MIKKLNTDQKKALKQLLNTKDNYFVSGVAGTGKSYVIKLFREIKAMNKEYIPMVASTGVAALLINGITFNSYFGLGIMAGGADATIKNAMMNRSLCERIIDTETIIIDEISMISGNTFDTANLLCQKIRQNKKLFGGIRVIIVGDFHQLGPFSETNKVDWAFNSKAWIKFKIKKLKLTKVMRTKDVKFIDILSKTRVGKVDKTVQTFLNKHLYKKDITTFDGPIILSRNKQVDDYNSKKLNSIQGNAVSIKTLYVGENHNIERMKENLVIPESITLKKGALVMLRVNNFNEGYVNGTIGTVVNLNGDVLSIKKINGEIIHVKKHIFEMLSGSGEVIAKAKNFPVALAWAVTIHKSQGASFDKALIALDNLWLHGQAYTAMSRLSSAEGLFIQKWNKSSFIVDPKVKKFSK